MAVNSICVVTNRNVDGDLEDPNPKGLGDVRVASVTKQGQKFRVDFKEDAKAGASLENLPSHQMFTSYLNELRNADEHCVCYVHGFNTKWKESLEEAWDIHKAYKVGVVLFSWPSNPGGFVTREYRRARRAAEASSPAFDATLDKMARYLEMDFCERREDVGENDPCEISFNLMCYSQGNYLLRRYVESSHFDGETRLFTNVVLMQADVNSDGHENWVERSGAFRRLYVTINENDRVLLKSEYLNPTRLGRTVNNLVARNARYVDFTDTPDIGRKHGFFKSKNQKASSQVRKFFRHVLRGELPERELKLSRDPSTTAYVVP